MGGKVQEGGKNEKGSREEVRGSEARGGSIGYGFRRGEWIVACCCACQWNQGWRKDVYSILHRLYATRGQVADIGE
jgi:hypothetical protein